jgi:hypothetical protein
MTSTAEIARTSTTRARVAFCTALGEAALTAVAPTAEGWKFARTALDLAERWVGGGSVAGEDLTRTMGNDNDEGLAIAAAGSTNKTEQAVWAVLLTIVAYTARHAYDSARRIPDEIACEVSEETLEIVCKQAIDAGIDAKFLDRAARLVAHSYPAANPNDFGQPIDVVQFLRTLGLRG